MALVSMLVEAAGLMVIWAAPGALLAFAGALLAGGGYLPAFQGYGVEAVRHAPPESRGSAMSAHGVPGHLDGAGCAHRRLARASGRP